ncbi:ABC transporter substrate-binding protein [Phycicoccus flavus]|uniref:ABC transporter substrate-binding protein n=1 Tax=Phycicoccus flavus TaxID=2502783 RepID=UPI000FEBA0AD|nr:extracellular solute-binding protein [Phycicoccus flavus]NHA67264.1 extracellular solute-binding protein [Phycicoccus flavus]
MSPTSRRQVLSTLGLLAATGALGACNTAPRTAGSGASGAGAPSGGSSGGSGNLAWWDQFNPLKSLQEKTFAAFTQQGGPKVDYTVYNPNDQGKALQLAFGSKQLPDVFSLAGVGVPVTVLLQQGWFSPLSTADDITSALGEDTLLDGVHRFEDKLYSFPIFSPRQYDALLWGNSDILQKAGVDPENMPSSWDDVRAAARAIQKSGTAGILLPLKFAERMQAFVLQLAQTAGFNGVVGGSMDGIDLSTGEYAFDDDAFVQAIEFLTAFRTDGSLFPASTSLDARAGRARWAAGAAGLVFDGPYNAGVVRNDFSSLLPKLAVGGIPTADGSPAQLLHSPIGGTFWLSGQSDKVDQASELMVMLSAKEYQQGLAEAMDQPPLDLAAVASSQAAPSYKKAIAMFDEQVRVGPTPEARNPAVATALGKKAPVEPSLGTIIQGVFSGQVTDVKGALTKLSDQSSAAREAAVSQVDGASVKDWAFGDVDRSQDFTAKDYAK